MIRLDMNILGEKPEDIVEKFAISLYKMLHENRDGILLMHSDAIRDFADTYKIDIKYSVDQKSFFQGMLAYAESMPKERASKSLLHISDARIIRSRYIASQEAFEFLLKHPRSMKAKENAKTCFLNVYDKEHDEGLKAWALLEPVIAKSVVLSEERLKANLEFIASIFVDPMNLLFITRMIYLKNAKGLAGYSSRTYQFDHDYEGWPYHWKVNQQYQHLPTLQDDFNIFRYQLKNCLKTNPNPLISDWLKENTPANDEDELEEEVFEPVQRPEQRQEHMNPSKPLFYLLILFISFYLADKLLRSTSDPSTYEYSDDDLENHDDSPQRDEFYAGIVALTGALWTAMLYKVDLYGAAAHSAESVANVVRLSLIEVNHEHEVMMRHQNQQGTSVWHQMHY